MQHLNELLEKLDLSEEKGILFLNKIVKWTNTSDFSSDINSKLDKISPDAVYYFLNQPFILFFDRTINENLKLKTEQQIFKEVWSWDKVPIVFFVYENDVKVYNAFHYQKNLDKLNSLELIDKPKDEIYKQFSFWNLQSGSTWNWLEQNFYTKGKRNIISQQRVNQKLFDNIKYAREQITADKTVSPELANLMLLRLIFIRYLIDRDVLIDEQFIKGKNKEERKQCFDNLIGNKAELQKFFDYLKSRFNGNLFDTSADTDIAEKNYHFLSDFFSAKSKNAVQLFYFDVFDFSVIPVEVISGIYESVIDDEKRKQHSAVYTPWFLVDYILEQTIEPFLKNAKSVNCKVLDPSCGSGIFLTQTYRRLVEKEIQLHGAVSDERLKEIAKQNIFGIDRDLNALHVAAFSIYIALLDYKQPPEIKVFHLPKLLGENLFRNDFFNETSENLNDGLVTHAFDEKFKTEIQFDFILGNPPWGSKNHKIRDRYHLNYIKSYNLPIARDEIAQTFLIRAKDFCQIKDKKNKGNETICSFIVTSKAFYNLWAKEFKILFFNNFFVDEIFDMSASRRLLFDGAINPAMIVRYRFAQLKNTEGNSVKNIALNTENNIVKHIALKPNRFLINFRMLCVEKNDKTTIAQKHFITYEWMLKLALYGGNMDFALLKRIIDNSKLNDLIDDKTIFKGSGFKEKPVKKFVGYLENIKVIENEQVNNYFTLVDNNFRRLKKDDLNLHHGSHIELFEGNHILLKGQTEFESNIVASFVDYTFDTEEISSFKHDVFSISSSKNTQFLKYLYSYIISNIYTYYQFLTTSAWGVATRPAIRLSEYLSFPYIEIKEKEYFIEQVEKFINRYKEYYTSFPRLIEPPQPETLPEFKEINRIVNEAYNISPIEEDLIDYVLNVSRYEFQESKLNKFLRRPTQTELLKYAQLFYDYFSEVYDSKQQYFSVEIYEMSSFIAMKFVLTKEKPTQQIVRITDKNEKELFQILSKRLSIYQLSSDIFTQKDIIGAEKGFFYIIKPNQYKSWHIARAHHDIATIRTSIIKAENDLNRN